jgi:multidrug resistance efflux pump
MLEILLCSLFTILPDYLYRRYAEGKRLGEQINIYSVWYELRYGIVSCLMLAVLLITLIFYYHPTTSSVTAFYRTIPIVPETAGRVSEIFVGISGDVEKGAPIFKMDSAKQQAALELANRRIAEVEAAMKVAEADIAATEGQLQQAKAALAQAMDELNTKAELQSRSPGIVAGREIEKLQKVVEQRQGGVVAAEAVKLTAMTKLSTLLPAEKASAEASRQQAQVDLDKMVVYAGVTGRVEQFAVRVGDIVNPFMRPAGVLIPKEAGRTRLFAGFNQLEAQVIKTGMPAEVTCISKPLTIIPMVVTGVQDYIAAGQFRTTEQLMDAQQVVRPGTLTVTLEPLYEGGLDGVTPGSSCVANAYTSNHDLLAEGKAGLFETVYLHLIDTVGAVHAVILRVQALMLPVKTLVLSGH